MIRRLPEAGLDRPDAETRGSSNLEFGACLRPMLLLQREASSYPLPQPEGLWHFLQLCRASPLQWWLC